MNSSLTPPPPPQQATATTLITNTGAVVTAGVSTVVLGASGAAKTAGGGSVGGGARGGGGGGATALGERRRSGATPLDTPPLEGAASQLKKCLNEKHRREQENIYLEELAELISASFFQSGNVANSSAASSSASAAGSASNCADGGGATTAGGTNSTLNIKPDKCAILQETVNQIRRIRQQADSDLQQSIVSSTKPTILGGDILGPLVLEALDGFLLVINPDGGRVEFVSANVAHYLGFESEELSSMSVYSIVHPGDHARFSSNLLPADTSASMAASTQVINPQKSRSFYCRFATKSPNGTTSGGGNNNDLTGSGGCGDAMLMSVDDVEQRATTARHYERMHISAVFLPPSTDEGDDDLMDVDSAPSTSCLLCIARRIPPSESNTNHHCAALMGATKTTASVATGLALPSSAPSSRSPASSPVLGAAHHIPSSSALSLHSHSGSGINPSLMSLGACSVGDGSANAAAPVVEQFTTKLDLRGEIIAIDTTGLNVAYAQYITRFACVGKAFRDLCDPRDVHKLDDHLSRTLEQGHHTSGTYRLVFNNGEKSLWVHTKSRRFNGNPGMKEPEFIMSTHSIFSDYDVSSASRFEQLTAGATTMNPPPHNTNTSSTTTTSNVITIPLKSSACRRTPSPAIGGIVMTSSPSLMTSSAGLMTSNSSSSMVMSNNVGGSWDSNNNHTSSSSMDTGIGASAGGSASSIKNEGGGHNSDSNDSPIVVGTSHVSRPPLMIPHAGGSASIPASPSYGSASGGVMPSSGVSANPTTPLSAPPTLGTTEKLRHLLTQGVSGGSNNSSNSTNSSSSSSSGNGSGNVILRELLNQDEGGGAGGGGGEASTIANNNNHHHQQQQQQQSTLIARLTAGPQQSHMGGAAGGGGSSSNSGGEGRDVMLRQLLNSGPPPTALHNHHHSQQSTSTSSMAANHHHNHHLHSTYHSSGVNNNNNNNPNATAASIASSVKNESSDATNALVAFLTEPVKPPSSRMTPNNNNPPPQQHQQQQQRLAGQNPMLASMLAQTPRPVPSVPTSIANSIVSQVPQDRLPKGLEKKLIHTPTTSTTVVTSIASSTASMSSSTHLMTSSSHMMTSSAPAISSATTVNAMSGGGGGGGSGTSSGVGGGLFYNHSPTSSVSGVGSHVTSSGGHMVGPHVTTTGGGGHSLSIGTIGAMSPASAVVVSSSNAPGIMPGRAHTTTMLIHHPPSSGGRLMSSNSGGPTSVSAPSSSHMMNSGGLTPSDVLLSSAATPNSSDALGRILSSTVQGSPQRAAAITEFMQSTAATTGPADPYLSQILDEVWSMQQELIESDGPVGGPSSSGGTSGPLLSNGPPSASVSSPSPSLPPLHHLSSPVPPPSPSNQIASSPHSAVMRQSPSPALGPPAPLPSSQQSQQQQQQQQQQHQMSVMSVSSVSQQQAIATSMSSQSVSASSVVDQDSVLLMSILDELETAEVCPSPSSLPASDEKLAISAIQRQLMSVEPHGMVGNQGPGGMVSMQQQQTATMHHIPIGQQHQQQYVMQNTSGMSMFTPGGMPQQHQLRLRMQHQQMVQQQQQQQRFSGPMSGLPPNQSAPYPQILLERRQRLLLQQQKQQRTQPQQQQQQMLPPLINDMVAPPNVSLQPPPNKQPRVDGPPFSPTGAPHSWGGGASPGIPRSSSVQLQNPMLDAQLSGGTPTVPPNRVASSTALQQRFMHQQLQVRLQQQQNAGHTLMRGGPPRPQGGGKPLMHRTISIPHSPPNNNYPPLSPYSPPQTAPPSLQQGSGGAPNAFSFDASQGASPHHPGATPPPAYSAADGSRSRHASNSSTGGGGSGGPPTPGNEYVRAELRSIVGARHHVTLQQQAPPPTNMAPPHHMGHAQSLNDLDAMGIQFDMDDPLTAAHPSQLMGVPGGSLPSVLGPQGGVHQAMGGANNGGNSASQKSLLQQLLSEPT